MEKLLELEKRVRTGYKKKKSGIKSTISSVPTYLPILKVGDGFGELIATTWPPNWAIG